MNKAKLKAYAPQARKYFIAAVTTRANQLGLSDKGGKLEVAPAEKGGDVVIIAGQPWPAKVQGQRKQLIKRIQKDGFAQTMEAVAYTWFNRFAALRFMEIHDYLGHGYRVLSNREGGLPEILAHATDLAQSGELPGLNAARVTELKLAGNKDGELYKMLLVAQCNTLSRAMPFLFEHIDDETELLLPDNLLRTDSIIATLVDALPEGDWQQVEIIGWLYQFYISEKKDQVIGKVVKSEDIPAATQLFTPNWIVQYLVQNSVGRLWMMANPTSTLKSQWPYYIEPADQTPEVQAQLGAVIQVRVDKDGGSLNPESITVLDPACGSGHILVEAYEVLKAIYLERGYRLRDIPRLILEKNLYGLDIDDRAAQMAGFALLMKARADDRRLLNEPPNLNVLAMQESKGLEFDELASQLTPFGMQRGPLKALLGTFAHAKTFGSLIQIPQELSAQLTKLDDCLQHAVRNGDLYTKAAAQDVMPLAEQATMLGMRFDAVVANPPYMGSGGMDDLLKKFAAMDYPAAKSDLMTCFMERGISLSREGGFIGMINLPSWLFLGSFEKLRVRLLRDTTIENLLHLGRGVFGSDFGSVAFVVRNNRLSGYLGSYRKLYVKQSEVASEEELKRRFFDEEYGRFIVDQNDFTRLPGYPIGYWISPAMRRAFTDFTSLGKIADARIGMATGRNDRYVRNWHEVSLLQVGFDMSSREEAKASGKKWFPHAKGGGYRKWYGNSEHLVNWQDDGHELQTTLHPSGKRVWAHNFNLEQIFKPGICWTTVTIADTSFRYHPRGFLFDAAAGICQPKQVEDMLIILGALNSRVSVSAIRLLNPTVNLAPGYLGRIPVAEEAARRAVSCVRRCLELARADWDSYETSWDFTSLPFLEEEFRRSSMKETFKTLRARWQEVVSEIQVLEKENNDVHIQAYGLQGELSPEVGFDEITLTCNPHYRFGGSKSVSELEQLLRTETVQEFVSYAIGCMMGRYSLDLPGLIYAHVANVGFDATRYKTFPADSDGIVPLTNELWFEDDAANRLREFLHAVWGAETLDENMAWLAESLGKKASETPEETIRRYLADKFFKDHLQTYKKRPIYWLFSSGKQGAFQALVYLHRYHEGTLARMRAEYVVPLTGKIQSRIDMLEKDAAAASSTAARNKLNKEVEGLRKKHVELLAYDEKLRHYADMRIKLDLDDGVKVNYVKFGDLLAEVKAVTGGAAED